MFHDSCTIQRNVFLESRSRTIYILVLLILASSVKARSPFDVPVAQRLEWRKLQLDEPLIYFETFPEREALSAVAIAASSNSLLKIQNISIFGNETSMTVAAMMGCGTKLSVEWTRRWGVTVALIDCLEETPIFTLQPSLRLVYKLPYPSSDITLWERDEDGMLAVAAATSNGLQALAIKESVSETPETKDWLTQDSESFALLPNTLHRIPSPRVLTHFRVDHRNFLAVVPNEDKAYPGLIVLAEDSRGQLRRFQRLFVGGPIIGVTHFSFSLLLGPTEHFIIVATRNPVKSPEEQISVVFKFENGSFLPFQSLMSPEPSKFIVLTGEAAVLAAWSPDGLTVFQYDGWRLVPVSLLSTEIQIEDLMAGTPGHLTTPEETPESYPDFADTTTSTTDNIETYKTTSYYTHSTRNGETSFQRNTIATDIIFDQLDERKTTEIPPEDDPRTEDIDIRIGMQEHWLQVLTTDGDLSFAIMDGKPKKILDIYRPVFNMSTLSFSAYADAKMMCDSALRETHDAIKMFKSMTLVVQGNHKGPLSDTALIKALFHQMFAIGGSNDEIEAMKPRVASHNEMLQRPTDIRKNPSEISSQPINSQDLSPTLNPQSESSQQRTNSSEMLSENSQEHTDKSQELSNNSQKADDSYNSLSQHSLLPTEPIHHDKQHAAALMESSNGRSASSASSCSLEEVGRLEGVERLAALDHELAAITIDRHFDLVYPSGSFLNYTRRSVFKLKDNGMRISEFSRIDLCNSSGVYIEGTGGGRTIGQAYAVEDGVLRLAGRVGVGERTSVRGICRSGRQCFLLYPKAPNNCAIQCHSAVTYFPCNSHPEGFIGDQLSGMHEARTEYEGAGYRLASNKEATLLCKYKNDGIVEDCNEIPEAVGAYQVAFAEVNKQLVALAVTPISLVVQEMGGKAMTKSVNNVRLQILDLDKYLLIALFHVDGASLYSLTC